MIFQYAITLPNHTVAVRLSHVFYRHVSLFADGTVQWHRTFAAANKACRFDAAGRIVTPLHSLPLHAEHRAVRQG